MKKKVSYKCEKKVFDGNVDQPSTAMDELGTEGQQVGHSGNFTLLWAKKLPGQKTLASMKLELMGRKSDLNQTQTYCFNHVLIIIFVTELTRP